MNLKNETLNSFLDKLNEDRDKALDEYLKNTDELSKSSYQFDMADDAILVSS